MPSIRKAEPGDARALAQVAERSFRDTFGDQNSAADMELHCATSYGESIQAREISAPHRATLLAVEEEQIVGFAQLRWGVAPSCVPAGAAGEIQRLYVTKDWHGRGVAPQLMGAALAEMKHRGSEVVWLGVWERNPRAISFYRKHGFAEVGEHTFPLGRDPQRDIIMSRSVGAAG